MTVHQTISPPLHYSQVDSMGLAVALTALRRPPALDDLDGRGGVLMISIKNRAFCGRLIGAWCEFAARHLARPYITIVDAPYLHNIDAQTADEEERARRKDRVFQLSDERKRNVERILRRPGNDCIRLIPWSELADGVPSWMTEEVRSAYAAGGPFRSAVAAHCRASVGAYDQAASPEAFELFLLEEVPILLYAYYLFEDGLTDFYPGPNPPLLWRIEAGEFVNELPQCTAAAKSHPGLIFGEVRLPEKA